MVNLQLFLKDEDELKSHIRALESIIDNCTQHNLTKSQTETIHSDIKTARKRLLAIQDTAKVLFSQIPVSFILYVQFCTSESEDEWEVSASVRETGIRDH